ncbi:MAG TPA: hypothetical protein VKB23_07980 [Solirubrobacterales bacterium]|nr:hypothetical protein [Solirubrobacterales bacterium]
MPGGRHSGSFRAARAIIALAVAAACLGSVAYAATRSDGKRSKAGKGKAPARGKGQVPSRPRLLEVPPATVVGDGYQFRFHVPPPPAQPGSGRPAPSRPVPPATKWRRFECRLDKDEWANCSSPLVLPQLDSGDHAFAVRALNPRGRPGPAAHYAWSQLEPKQLTIEPQVGPLEELMPGAPPQPLPVRIGNPNPVPIEVTSISVAVAPRHSDCPGDPNFAVTAASLTPAAPLTVPPGGAVSLPSATAPTVALRELPIDQNACQGTSIDLLFSGEARG